MAEEKYNEQDIERVDKLIKENLPKIIDGYTLRQASLNNIGILQYSKPGGYLLQSIIKKQTNIEGYKKDVLYEVVSNTLEEAYLKLKDKLDLNKRVKNDFPRNIVIGFHPNFKVRIEGYDKPIKPFEVYLVLDTNSDAQFFCAVLLEPLHHLPLLITLLNDLKNKIKNKTLLNLSGEGFNYQDFDLPRKIHIYNYDFKSKKEDIRKILKNNRWNVQFKDKYYFKKQENNSNIPQKIILCEGKNVELFNNLMIPEILFSSEHNSGTIFHNIKTKIRYAIRDKDYLITEEINRLQKKFPKYYILKYYCIENYLYHPDNIQELGLSEFYKDQYILNIIEQKNDIIDDVIFDIKTIRKSYKELTENHINTVKDSLKILVRELRSNDFEEFYQHFDMKQKFKRGSIQHLNLNDKKLAKTEWFKNKIMQIINM